MLERISYRLFSFFKIYNKFLITGITKLHKYMHEPL